MLHIPYTMTFGKSWQVSKPIDWRNIPAEMCQMNANIYYSLKNGLVDYFKYWHTAGMGNLASITWRIWLDVLGHD